MLNRLISFSVLTCICIVVSSLTTAHAATADLFVTDYTNHAIYRIDGDTGENLGVFASLNYPTSLTFGTDGDLYVSKRNTDQVVRLDGDTGSAIETFISSGLSITCDLAFGPDGNLYVSSNSAETIVQSDGTSTQPFAQSALLAGPHGLLFHTDGDLYVVGNRSLNVVRFDGDTGAVIGQFTSGGPFLSPIDLEFGQDGNLYVSDYTADAIFQVQRYHRCLYGCICLCKWSPRDGIRPGWQLIRL